MVQRISDTYHVDPADPRAPTQAEWDRMTPAERERVVAMLPSEGPLELMPPEGDPHWNAKADARRTLEAFFRRTGRKVYLSSELAVFYPGEPRFAPDVLAVLDVEPHDRTKWVVTTEGKGLDLVIEVHHEGDPGKDYQTNVERYARLGVAEYFIFDRGKLTLHGFRLPKAAGARKGRIRAYQPILPQQGRYPSEVLGLDLMVVESKMRFFVGMAPLPEAEELIAKLGSMLDDVILHQQDAEKRAELEAKRADEAEKRAELEAKRADEAERLLAEARATIERLKARPARE